MFVFQWNSMRVGEHVMVHDDLDAAFSRSSPGIVKYVETREHNPNDVTIRVDGETFNSCARGGTQSHMLPLDRRFSCWRCDIDRRQRFRLVTPRTEMISGLGVTGWEYLIVSLPAFEAAKYTQGESAAVDVLNREGAAGWEAVGMSTLTDSSVAVLLKRRTAGRTPRRLGDRR